MKRITLLLLITALISTVLLSGCTEQTGQLEKKPLNTSAITQEELEEGTKDLFTPLEAAAYWGHLDQVKKLVEQGADVNAKGRYTGESPIYSASYGGNVELMKYLISKGSEFNKSETVDGVPMLQRAIANKHYEMARYLILQGVNVNAKNDFGNTALGVLTNFPSRNVTLQQERLNLAKTLIDNGANVSAADNSGVTPLHNAAFTDDMEMVAFLLENGADRNAKTTDGKTPYELAETAEIRALLK